nr:hypothetical protein GZ28G7_30 [uncultured archaeon GZfos28G7]
MSASTTHACPTSLTVSICSIACFALFPGRYPKLESRNSASNIGSMTFFKACCTTLSLIVGMPSGRCLPSGFGIYTLFTGLGLYLSCRSSRGISLRFCSRFRSNSSIVTSSIPPAPLFCFTFSHASLRFLQFQTLSIKECHFLFFFRSFLTNPQQAVSMHKPPTKSFRQPA